MTRDKFFQMCIHAAVKLGGYSSFRDAHWNDDELVEFGGATFYPAGYKLTFDRYGKAVHAVILHDLKTNSVVVARLEEIKQRES